MIFLACNWDTMTHATITALVLMGNRRLVRTVTARQLTSGSLWISTKHHNKMFLPEASPNHWRCRREGRVLRCKRTCFPCLSSSFTRSSVGWVLKMLRNASRRWCDYPVQKKSLQNSGRVCVCVCATQIQMGHTRSWAIPAGVLLQAMPKWFHASGQPLSNVVNQNIDGRIKAIDGRQWAKNENAWWNCWSNFNTRYNL